MRPAGRMRFIDPLMDENARLVNQGGLFTTVPAGLTVDEWLRAVVNKDEDAGMLVKISIPNVGREDCLRSLNAMNINRSSLFPDLAGAAAFCNMSMEIENY